MAITYATERITVNSAQLVHWNGSASADAISLEGPCPACGDATANEIPRRISALASRTVQQQQPLLTVEMACACTEEHPGRPSGVTNGCGRSWLAMAAISSNGTVTLAPGPPPTDPQVAAAAQALRAAGPKQLADIRAAAEKWIGGLTALFSLFGLAGLVTSRSTLTSLATGWQVLIAIGVVVAAALAGLAIYRIYRAAYGWPVTRPVNNDRELLAWYAAQEAAPRVQAACLRDGVRAAGGALVALIITAGLLLLAPSKTPTVPFVQVTLTDGSQVCGTLLPATPGATLIRRAGDGNSVNLAPRSIEAETVVAAC
jgi:hypothetical protein